MRTSSEFSRRDALKAGVALLLGFHLPARGQNPPLEGQVNAWISITVDNRITLLTEVPEMGQGTRTANAMMLAEELEADWTTIRVEQAPTIPAIYKHLGTGGSGGTAGTWTPLRRAGAQGRELMLLAAAQRWSVPKSECRASLGTVVHTPTGRVFRYGELVETASKLLPFKLEEVRLKDPATFRYIGKPMARIDTPAKADGSAVFGIDVRVPGMLFAVIARCPHFGGELAACDDTAAKAVPGVHAVFPVPPIGFVPGIGRNVNVAGGVAVVAKSTWIAMQGRNTLKITWRKKPGVPESTESMGRLFQEAVDGPPTVTGFDRGDVSQALAAAAKKVEADYELPFQAHATMEPMNATMHVRGNGRIEVWSPTQIAALSQTTVAQLAGISPESVTVHMTFSGGSFGRRYQWGYLAEAYQVANAMKVPVQLLWTREDDMQHDFYRQYSRQRLRGAVDGEGNIVAWWQRVTSTPIRPVFDAAELLKDPKHVASQEIDFADGLRYWAQHFRLDYAPVPSLVPRAWWRSVSSSFDAFAAECFLDELAHAAGHDPYEFRLKVLRADQPERTRKLRAVLRLAAEKAGWGQALPVGSGRGIACYAFGGTYIAQVAEVTIARDGVLRVNRVVSAVDCGLAVNPDSVRAQIEGGINYALTPVLSGEITIRDGAVVQSNFHNYQVLRMKDAPQIVVHIVPAEGKPADGVGEAGVPPLAPAVANAIFAATGKRVRQLPITKIV